MAQRENSSIPEHRASRDGLPTGTGTAGENDVADPHPATEQDYDKIPHPGGTANHKDDEGKVNSYAHDGKQRPRPKNAGAGPQ